MEKPGYSVEIKSPLALQHAGDCTLAIVSFLCAEDGWGLTSSLVFRRGRRNLHASVSAPRKSNVRRQTFARVLLPTFDNSSQCWLHHLKLGVHFLDLRSLLFKPSGHRFQLAL